MSGLLKERPDCYRGINVLHVVYSFITNSSFCHKYKQEHCAGSRTDPISHTSTQIKQAAMSPLTRQFIIIFFLTCYTSDIGMGYWHTLTSKLKGLFSLGGRFKCSQLRLCRVLGRSKQSSYKEFWFGFPLFLWSLKHGAAIKFSVYGPFCIRGFTEASYPIYRCCIHGCFPLLMQPARLMLFVATQDGKLGSERDI